MDALEKMSAEFVLPPTNDEQAWLQKFEHAYITTQNRSQRTVVVEQGLRTAPTERCEKLAKWLRLVELPVVSTIPAPPSRDDTALEVVTGRR